MALFRKESWGWINAKLQRPMDNYCALKWANMIGLRCGHIAKIAVYTKNCLWGSSKYICKINTWAKGIYCLLSMWGIRTHTEITL